MSRRILGLTLGTALALGAAPGIAGRVALAEGDGSTYTLTIPSTLTVANSGWNATDGISATGELGSGKKLTVTASSENSFRLKSGNNEVGYKLATASTDTEATTSWTFDSLSSTATKKDMGIIVEDYSNAPAGTYTDTVTFTASVESVDNAPTLNVETMSFTSWGVSNLTTTSSNNVFQYYTSTRANDAVINKNATNKFTALGDYKIYKIVISGGGSSGRLNSQLSGTGWSGATYTSSDGATEVVVNTGWNFSGDSSDPLVFTVYYE